MSRQVLAIFLCIILMCAAALAWLGGQVLEQDRSLESQRVRERLESAAEHIAGTLERGLSLLDSKPPPDGAVTLSASSRGVRVQPAGGLLYYPAAPAAGDADEPKPIFAEGERLEYQRSDPAKAAEFF